jgi:hypothetical protein
LAQISKYFENYLNFDEASLKFPFKIKPNFKYKKESICKIKCAKESSPNFNAKHVHLVLSSLTALPHRDENYNDGANLARKKFGLV